MHKQGVGEFPYYVGINSLSELATKDDRVVVLNILGKESALTVLKIKRGRK